MLFHMDPTQRKKKKSGQSTSVGGGSRDAVLHSDRTESFPGSSDLHRHLCGRINDSFCAWSFSLENGVRRRFGVVKEMQMPRPWELIPGFLFPFSKQQKPLAHYLIKSRLDPEDYKCILHSTHIKLHPDCFLNQDTTECGGMASVKLRKMSTPGTYEDSHTYLSAPILILTTFFHSVFQYFSSAIDSSHVLTHFPTFPLSSSLHPNS